MPVIDGKLCCSFCAKPEEEIRELIIGPQAEICNECVYLIIKYIRKKRTNKK
jgi:ATP-dependent Clp protease ATP-binding subunit ClpX